MIALTAGEAIEESRRTGQPVTITRTKEAEEALLAASVFVDELEATCGDATCGEKHEAIGFEGADWYVVLLKGANN